MANENELDEARETMNRNLMRKQKETLKQLGANVTRYRMLIAKKIVY